MENGVQKKTSKMGNEEKKEWLRRYCKIQKDLRRLTEELHVLRAARMSVSANIGDGMPHAHNGGDLSDYVVKCEEIEKKIIRARYLRVKITSEIIEAIETLSDEDEKEVLLLRYVRMHNWDKISERTSYSKRNVLYIHGRALEHLEVVA